MHIFALSTYWFHKVNKIRNPAVTFNKTTPLLGWKKPKKKKKKKRKRIRVKRIHESNYERIDCEERWLTFWKPVWLRNKGWDRPTTKYKRIAGCSIDISWPLAPLFRARNFWYWDEWICVWLRFLWKPGCRGYLRNVMDVWNVLPAGFLFFPRNLTRRASAATPADWFACTERNVSSSGLFSLFAIAGFFSATDLLSVLFFSFLFFFSNYRFDLSYIFGQFFFNLSFPSMYYIFG